MSFLQSWTKIVARTDLTLNNTFIYFLRNVGRHPKVSMLFLVMKLEIDIPTLILGEGGRIRNGFVVFFAVAKRLCPGLYDFFKNVILSF